jgi:hypothetical protein
MPKFKVLKGHDAYAVHVAIIEAETVEQANEFAEADKYAGIWHPTGEVREFEKPQIFEDETELVADDEELEDFVQLDLSLTQRDTILAALRLWQSNIKHDYPDLGLLEEIATNADQHPALTNEEIDELCEALNG